MSRITWKESQGREERGRHMIDLLLRIYDGEDISVEFLNPAERRQILGNLQRLRNKGLLDGKNHITEKGIERCQKRITRYSSDEDTSLGNFVLKMEDLKK